LITRQQVYVGNKESEMRTFILAFAATGLLIAQKPQVPLLEVLIGQLIAVSGDRIEVGDADGTHVLYSDAASAIWRGKDYHDFSVLRPGDEVAIAYRNDAQSRAVVIDLSANIDQVEGRITRVGRDGFQVDENYNAAPDSGYRRGLREIVYDSGTTWADSLAEDLKAGRDVFVIGLRLPGGKLEATRVTVYEGQAPVRMGTSSRCIGPAKEAH
jgi:hypothetical protein